MKFWKKNVCRYYLPDGLWDNAFTDWRTTDAHVITLHLLSLSADSQAQRKPRKAILPLCLTAHGMTQVPLLSGTHTKKTLHCFFFSKSVTRGNGLQDICLGNIRFTFNLSVVVMKTRQTCEELSPCWKIWNVWYDSCKWGLLLHICLFVIIPATKSVPQVSVLAPVVFSLYYWRFPL